MNKIKITCHDGEVYFVEVESYDPVDINKQLNNHEVLTVTIGDLVISRIDIKRISPVEESVE